MDSEFNIEKMPENLKKFNDTFKKTVDVLKDIKHHEEVEEEIQASIQNNIAIITVNIKRATMKDAPKFKSILESELSNNFVFFVINLLKVEHIDSTFLGEIICLLKKVMPSKGRVLILSNNESVKSLFVLTRLLRELPIYSSLEEAVVALG